MKIKRVVLRKLLAGVLLFGLLLPAVSCTEETKETEPSSGDFVAGNPDWENTYYSTKLISIPRTLLFVFGFSNDSGPSFIGYDTNVDDSGNYHCEYILYNCDYEGNVLSEYPLEDSSELEMSTCCSLDNNRFIVVGTSDYEYRIYDYEGKVIREEESEPAWSRRVSKTSEGFVIVSQTDDYGKITWYDDECNVVDEITKMQQVDSIDSIGFGGVFEQNGKYYLYGSYMTGPNESSDTYYSIDRETGTIESLSFRPNSVSEFYPPVCVFCADYHGLFSGADVNATKIYEIDVANQKAEILADVSNMLLCPPTYGGDVNEPYRVLDKTHFYIPYTYPGADLGVTEIALIVPDPTIDLSKRTSILIQGVGVISDSILKRAAYYYNVSHDEYYIKIDDLGSRYVFSTPESMNMTKLQLMAQYNNGNVPDIFYGDFFDYNYMGENGMVIDMSQYLGDDPIYDRMTRDDGKIYQVYAGYTLSGYLGQEGTYENGLRLDSLPNIPDGQKRFGASFSPDLVYFSIGSNLCSIYRNGELTYDNVLLAVRTAIETCDDPDYQYTDFTPVIPEDVGNGTASLIIGNITSPQAYYDLAQSFRATPVFVGYPSFSGSIHMITPQSLMAVSASTQYADVCCDFIKTIMDVDTQHMICASGVIPVNDDVLSEMIEFVKDLDATTEDMRRAYSKLLIYDRSNESSPRQVPMPADLAESYLAQIETADTVQIYDWGLWVMIRDEVSTYYTQGKSVEDVADALYSRLLVYAGENY